jgi:hypothetical protein
MTWTPLSFSSGQILTADQINNLQGNASAVRNKHKGSTAPDSPVAGTDWIDDSASPWIWKIYDGTSWTEFAEIDTTVSETRPRNPITIRNESGGATASLESHTSTGSGAGGNVELLRSRGTAASPTVIKSGDTIGSVLFQGHNGSMFRTAASFVANAAEDWSVSAQGTELVFSTNANGEVGDVNPRLKIKSNGQMDTYLRINMLADQSSGNLYSLLSAATYGNVAPTTNFSAIFLKKASGSSNTPTAISSGDSIGNIQYQGYDGTDFFSAHQEVVNAVKNFTGSQHDIRLDRLMTLTNLGQGLSNYQSIYPDGGMVYGVPTGGSKGYGTINAQALYDDGTLLTCYPLEYARTGKLDIAKWDSLVPQRPPMIRNKITVVKNQDGAETIQTTKEEVPSPTRMNDKARAFLQNADMLLDPQSFANFWQANGHLPAFPSVNSWEQLSVGDISQRLWETVEIQAVHIAKLTARINSLEARGITVKAG